MPTGHVMIHPVDGGYVISSGGVWLPGHYATERAARYAFRFSNLELEQLNATRGVGKDYRPITVECLHEWRYGRDGRIRTDDLFDHSEALNLTELHPVDPSPP